MLNLALLGAKISQREQLLRQASLWLAPVRTGSLVSLASRTMPITFSRSTTTTFLDKDGLLKTAGINVPVIEYDVNGNCLGLRVWGVVTNLFLQSNSIGVSPWGTNNAGSVTYTSNAALSPAGVVNARRITATADFAGPNQFASVTSGTTYTASFFVKAVTSGSLDELRLELFDYQLRFKISTQVFSQVNANFTAYGAINYGNGWYRLYASAAAPSTGSLAASLYAYQSADVHAWGAQFQAGTLGPYVPTTTLAASSTADVMTITGADAARIINGAQFTVYMDGYRTFTGNFPDYPNFYAISDGSSSNSCASYGAQGGQLVTNYSITSNSALQTDFVGVNLSNQQSMKIVQALSANDSRFGVNGTLTAADTSVVMPVGLNKISIGSDAVNGNPGNFYIREFAIFRNSLPSRSLALLMQ
jgi:hypothetical protein